MDCVQSQLSCATSKTLCDAEDFYDLLDSSLLPLCYFQLQEVNGYPPAPLPLLAIKFKQIIISNLMCKKRKEKG